MIAEGSPADGHRTPKLQALQLICDEQGGRISTDIPRMFKENLDESEGLVMM